MQDELPILLVEDDENDALLMRRAFEHGGLTNPLEVAHTGEQAIAYLSGTFPFCDRNEHPLPLLILLDLSLPGKSGFEILQWIKHGEQTRRIPVIVLTDSNSLSDVNAAYANGANSFFLKDIDLVNAVEFCTLLRKYWIERALIPQPHTASPLTGTSDQAASAA